MPNLLVHYAIQGPSTEFVFRGIDIKWVLLGIVVPDLPWLGRRLVRAIAPGVDPYDIVLYATVQASFVFCLILAAALSAISTKPRLVLSLIAFNSLFHLILDATQTKWGNGVHLFAPFSWDILSLDWLWPENILFYASSAAGLLFIVWLMTTSRARPIKIALYSSRRVIVLFFFLALYFFAPFAFMEGPAARDAHFVDTLRNGNDRIGRRVALDRARIERLGDGYQVTTYAGEKLRLEGDFDTKPGKVSIIGSFITADKIYVTELHQNDAWFRDAASILGLILLALAWVKPIVTNGLLDKCIRWRE
jgi:hypothetical protein